MRRTSAGISTPSASLAPARCRTCPAARSIVVLNHPSWWDPLIAVLLTGSMPAWRVHYGPIEAVGLDQYRFLARLGFFGIDTGTAAGSPAIPPDEPGHPGPARVGPVAHGGG